MLLSEIDWPAIIRSDDFIHLDDLFTLTESQEQIRRFMTEEKEKVFITKYKRRLSSRIPT